MAVESLVTCPDCGALVLDPEAQYCARCGSPFVSEDEPEAAFPPMCSDAVTELMAHGKWRQAEKRYRREENLDAATAMRGIDWLATLVMDADDLRTRIIETVGETMAGKTETEIRWAAGPPQRIRTGPHEKVLIWERPGYALHLSFTRNGVCQGIRRETIN